MVQFKNLFTGAEKRPTAAPPRCRNASAPGQAQRPGQCRLPPAITLSSRCWGISPSAIISGRRHHLCLGLCLQGDRAAQRQAPGHHLSHRRPGASVVEEDRGLFDDKIIGHESNLWAMGPTGPCGFAPKFLRPGPVVAGGPPGSPEEDGDRFWNSGTWFHAVRAGGREHPSICPSPPSIPAWGWSASPPSCRASPTITTWTCSAT